MAPAAASHWPTPKATLAMLALIAAVGAVAVPIISAFYVRQSIYQTDREAQRQINATVHENVNVITVKLDAIKASVEAGQDRTEKTLDSIAQTLKGHQR